MDFSPQRKQNKEAIMEYKKVNVLDKFNTSAGKRITVETDEIIRVGETIIDQDGNHTILQV